jgi:hypothetical protein
MADQSQTKHPTQANAKPGAVLYNLGVHKGLIKGRRDRAQPRRASRYAVTPTLFHSASCRKMPKALSGGLTNAGACQRSRMAAIRLVARRARKRSIRLCMNRLFRRLMVNEGMVNARSSCAIHAHFCVIFLVSGRFPRFKNPVKYSQRIDINHDAVHFAPAAGPAPQLFSCDISALVCA